MEIVLIGQLRQEKIDVESLGFPATQPVIIGALGGAGTRLGVKLLRTAGFWMGDRVDPRTEDSLVMRSYLNAWFNPIIEAVQTGQRIHKFAFEDLQRALSIHRENIPNVNAPWGWKNPRNMWLIPFFAEAFPQLKFIHMIRDVREMATSENNFLRATSGRLLLHENLTDDMVLAQVRLWTIGNKIARQCARSVLGASNYFVIRYEDLCLKPHPVIEKLFAFLDIDLDDTILDECIVNIQPSTRLGKWRRNDAAGGIGLETETVTVLESFGYQV